MKIARGKISQLIYTTCGVSVVGAFCATSDRVRAQDVIQHVVPQAAEFGRVQWERDLDAVLARDLERPVLVLFQEVPG
ncbi:MAG: hypothetical protein KDC95_02675 [Planctomycetes bacterium]|nr:hypothetical protein [Planctomycetota bacterium]